MNNVDTYKKVSAERIQSEWMKCLKAADASEGFRLMMLTGLLGATVPELVDSVGCTQSDWHAYDVWTHTLAVLRFAKKDPLVQLAALFHDVSKPECKGIHKTTGKATFYNHEERGADITREIMTRLKFSNDEINTVSHLVRHHLIPHDERLSSAALRRWVIKVGAEHVDRVLDLAQADLEGKGPAVNVMPLDFVKRFRERIAFQSAKAPIVSKTGQLAINGKDIMDRFELGSGQIIGDMLMSCLRYVTDFPEHNTKEDLFSHLTEWIKV